MKVLNQGLVLFILILFYNCKNEAQVYSKPHNTEVSQYSLTNGISETIEMKPITDPRTGRVASYLPLPKAWKNITNPDGTQGFSGPNGIAIQSAPNEIYYFNVDAYTAQMAGRQVSNPIELQTILEQHLKPNIQQQGGKLIRIYALEEMAQRNGQLLQSVLVNSQIQSYKIIASEWQQPSGFKSLILLSQNIAHSQGSSYWTLGLTELEAPDNLFEEAKNTYLFGLNNLQVDRETAMAHLGDIREIQRQSAERLAISREAHNRKMKSNEAAFQATQKTLSSTAKDISDMSMRGYWTRSEVEDRMRKSEVNMINQESTMTNPWNNQSLQVQTGYNTYYINANGDVIGSNDANFNPNVHSDYKNTVWRVLPEAKN